jgi:hypothetical protein
MELNHPSVCAVFEIFSVENRNGRTNMWKCEIIVGCISVLNGKGKGQGEKKTKK